MDWKLYLYILILFAILIKFMNKLTGDIEDRLRLIEEALNQLKFNSDFIAWKVDPDGDKRFDYAIHLKNEEELDREREKKEREKERVHEAELKRNAKEYERKKRKRDDR